jgi:hypothetical protein
MCRRNRILTQDAHRKFANLLTAVQPFTPAEAMATDAAYAALAIKRHHRDSGVIVVS